MRTSTAATAFLLGTLTGVAVACAPVKAAPSPGPTGDTQDLCRGAPVPAGWLTVDSRWDTERCPQSAGRSVAVTMSSDPGDNVLTIWRFDDKPVGTEKQVCEGSPTPPGGVATRHRWDPDHCRLGAGVHAANVKTIRRVS